MILQSLKTALLEILNEIQNSDINLILGGGYGIYLRIRDRRQSNASTLFNEWPEERSTGDIDLFLRPELLINSEKLKPLLQALYKLNYQPVPTAKYYQFYKPGPGNSDAGMIKIDILTGPRSFFKNTKVKTDHRRVKPKPSMGIHAHPTNEAFTLEEGLFSVEITGKLSGGSPFTGEVFLPHAFTFLLMKLYAFKDRFNDPNKEFGRYHALDMYSVLASTTETEWDGGLELRDKYINDSVMKEAGNIVSTHFATTESMGILRLKESKYYRTDFDINGFISALGELFPHTV